MAILSEKEADYETQGYYDKISGLHSSGGAGGGGSQDDGTLQYRHSSGVPGEWGAMRVADRPGSGDPVPGLGEKPGANQGVGGDDLQDHIRKAGYGGFPGGRTDGQRADPQAAGNGAGETVRHGESGGPGTGAGGGV